LFCHISNANGRISEESDFYKTDLGIEISDRKYQTISSLNSMTSENERLKKSAWCGVKALMKYN
jgi:hypothetical protein